MRICPFCKRKQIYGDDHFGDCPFAKMDDLTHHGFRDLTVWLIERRDNCLRIAPTKQAQDRAGWEDDALLFQLALDAVSTNDLSNYRQLFNSLRQG